MQQYREILPEGMEIERHLGLAMRVVPCASSSTIDAGSEGLHAEVGNRPVAGECFHQCQGCAGREEDREEPVFFLLLFQRAVDGVDDLLG